MDTKRIADELGRAEIAESVGVGIKAVSNHVTGGRFPARWWKAMRELAVEKEFELPMDAFDFAEPAESGAAP